jgi:hypothetical protein
MAVNKHDHNGEHEVRVPDMERPEVRHEVRDVNAWAVGKFGIALVLLCIASLAILFGVFRYLMADVGGKLPEKELNVDARQLPVEPRLQRSPILDLQRFKAAEDQILTGYGWVDQQKGVVHIPVDRAMDILAQRGLPSRAPNSAPLASGVSVPSEAGLGPKVQQPGGPLADELANPAAAQTAAPSGAAGARRPDSPAANPGGRNGSKLFDPARTGAPPRQEKQ